MLDRSLGMSYYERSEVLLHKESKMLLGKFHVHLTIKSQSDLKIPSWKQTIILLSSSDKDQLDIMYTKHYFIPSRKTQSIDCIKKDIAECVEQLQQLGIEVVRVKLEHESLPTIPTTTANYRECHIKVLADKLKVIPEGFVKSKNPIEDGVYFINKRWYSGDIDDIQQEVDMKVQELGDAVKEVKVESIIYDTNKSLDNWWV